MPYHFTQILFVWVLQPKFSQQYLHLGDCGHHRLCWPVAPKQKMAQFLVKLFCIFHENLKYQREFYFKVRLMQTTLNLARLNPATKNMSGFDLGHIA